MPPGGSDSKESTCNAGDPQAQSLGRPPGKVSGPLARILAWGIPWTEGPDWYSPWGFRVGHDEATNTHVYIGKKHNIYKSQYLYYQRSLLGYSPWGRKE